MERQPLEPLDLSPLALHRRISHVEQHAEAMTQWKKSVDENTIANRENAEIQREMLIVGKNLIAAMHVLGWMGVGAKWVTRIGAALGTIWFGMRAFITHFNFHP